MRVYSSVCLLTRVVAVNTRANMQPLYVVEKGGSEAENEKPEAAASRLVGHISDRSAGVGLMVKSRDAQLSERKAAANDGEAVK